MFSPWAHCRCICSFARIPAAGRWSAFLPVALTIILLKAHVVPYRPLKPIGILIEEVARRALAIAWWLWAAWSLVGVVEALVVSEHRPREGKLLQDLLPGLIYLAVILAVIAYVFDLPIQGLPATSGVIAIILGLALQSTLNDVFPVLSSISAGRINQANGSASRAEPMVA